jgi:DNA replication protein DnaC
VENLGDVLKKLEQGQIPATREPGNAASNASPNGGDGGNGGTGDGSNGDGACPHCAGSGWFTLDVPVGHPDFGLVMTCECQEDRIEGEGMDRLVRYSNLGQLARFSFDSLTPPTDGDRETVGLFQAAKERAAEFAEDPVGWLVFVGPHGSGKTRMAAAIANRCIERGYIALFVHVPDLMDHLRSSFGPNSEVNYSDLFDQVRSTSLLILDDLSSASSSPWATEKLQQIVNHRFSNELPTVFTSSTPMNEVDPYLRSRLETPQLSRVLALKAAQAESELGSIPPDMLGRMTFKTYDARGNSPSAAQRTSLERALDAAKGFAAFPNGWLTLWGPTGVGKTHLSIAIAGECLKRGEKVFFAFVPDLLDHLRSAYGPSSAVSYDQVFDQVRNADLLILDDLGQERGGAWAEEKLYQIVVHRHNLRLPTVITTLDDFDGELGPIRSRANDKAVGYVVAVKAPDFRGKKRNSRRANKTTSTDVSDGS